MKCLSAVDKVFRHKDIGQSLVPMFMFDWDLYHLPREHARSACWLCMNPEWDDRVSSAVPDMHVCASMWRYRFAVTFLSLVMQDISLFFFFFLIVGFSLKLNPCIANVAVSCQNSKNP